MNTHNDLFFIANSNSFETYGLLFRNSPDVGLSVKDCQNVKIGAPSKGNILYGSGRLDAPYPYNFNVYGDFYNPELQLFNCQNCLVQSNQIGITETNDKPNRPTAWGITASGQNIRIGGSRSAGEGNAIGNCYFGVSAWNIAGGGYPANGKIELFGNNIGTDFTGQLNFGNSSGSDIYDQQTQFLIGDDDPDHANFYRFNEQAFGVSAEGRVPFHRNLFLCNEAGPLVVAPSAHPLKILSASDKQVSGLANPFDLVEVFQSDNSSCPMTACQGTIFLGKTTADAAGKWMLNSTFPIGKKVTATASATDWTFGFSNCEVVVVVNCASMVATISPTPNTTVLPCPSGSILLTASGGTTFLWSNGATTASITASQPTTYAVTVTASNGCTDSTSTTLTATPTPDLIVAQTQPPVMPFSADLTISGGTPPFKYEWSGAETGQKIGVAAGVFQIPDLSVGTYFITLTDANGCTITQTFTISECPIQVSSIVLNDFCANGGGAIDLMATTTSMGQLSFLWSNGATTEDLTNLAAGVYTVTVTLTNGAMVCTTTHSATVEATLPALSISNKMEVCQSNNLFYTVSFQVAGGTGPYFFNLQLLPNGTFQSPQIASGQMYSFDIFDSKGCKITVSGQKNCACTSTPFPILTVSGPSFCAGKTVQLHESSGLALQSWQWSGPNGFTSTLQNPTVVLSVSGPFSVTITDAAGCTGVASKQVLVDALPVVKAVGPTDLCEKQSILLEETGGATSATRKWKGPNGFVSPLQNPTISLATTAVSGRYFVIVTSSAGCTATDSLDLVVHPTAMTELDTTICAGEAFFFNGINRSKSGTYLDTLATSFGCDSLLRLTLTVKKATIVALDDSKTMPPDKTEINIHVIENDTLAGGWMLTILENPTIGTATNDGSGNLHFRLPQAISDGRDSLHYVICSTVCPAVCDSAWVRVSILKGCIGRAMAKIPNGLVPESDQLLNKTFDPLYFFEQEGCPFDASASSLVLFGRDGQVVWKADPYEANEPFRGGSLPMATYYFILKMDFGGEKVVLKGPLTIVRP